MDAVHLNSQEHDNTKDIEMQFLMALLEHPVIFVILLIIFMGFISMTYEFILCLFGKSGMKGWLTSSDNKSRWPDDLEDDPPPPEPAKVPNPTPSPTNTMSEEKEIDGGEEEEDDDGNTSFSYTYSSYGDVPEYWSKFPIEKDDSK